MHRGLLLLFILLYTPGTTIHAQWVQMNGPYGGTINCLIANGPVVFAGTENGIYCSTDNGEHWASSGPSNARINCLTNLNQSLIVGTDIGLYRFTDNGKNWSRFGFSGKGVYTLTSNDTALFVATSEDGVYRSTDSGANWLHFNKGLEGRLVTALTSKGTSLFAGTYQSSLGSMIYRSTDNGEYWEKLGNIGNTVSINKIVVKDSVLFIAAGYEGIFRSTDDGNSWTELTVDAGKPYIVDLVVQGSDIFAASTDMYRSSDHGEHWVKVINGLTGNSTRALGANNTTVFIGLASGGVYRSIDRGENWSEANTGLQASSILTLASDGQRLLAGTNGDGIHFSNDNGNTWNRSTNLPPNLVINIIGANNSTAFAGTSHQGGLYRSTDHGNSWARASRDGFGQWGINSVYSLAVDDTSVYVGGQLGFQLPAVLGYSSNNGITWIKRDTGLPDERVYALLIRENLVLAGLEAEGVYRSTDYGRSWSPAQSVLVFSSYVQALAAHGTRIFAGTEHGVYRSNDDGLNWTKVSTGLPDTYVYAIVVYNNTIFIGGNGVWRSTNDGESWEPVYDGPTALYTVRTLLIHDSELYAGVEDGGIWHRPLSEISSTPTNTASTATNSVSITAYPNPLRSTGTISYSLPQRSSVTITITDALGRIVAVPVQDQVQESGEHRVVIGTSGLGSGVYLCRLQAGSTVVDTRLVIV